MFGIGTGEILVLLFIALVVLGPDRMPKLARDVGRALGDLRKTSDELRAEFLNADKMIDLAARQGSSPAAAADVGAVADSAAPSAPDEGAHARAAPSLTGAPSPEAEVIPEPLPGGAAGEDAAAPTGEVETVFDRDARLARERLDDPERAKQAAAEGWKTPTDTPGTSDRWG